MNLDQNQLEKGIAIALGISAPRESEINSAIEAAIDKQLDSPVFSERQLVIDVKDVPQTVEEAFYVGSTLARTSGKVIEQMEQANSINRMAAALLKK